jgi:hypothetical protein
MKAKWLIEDYDQDDSLRSLKKEIKRQNLDLLTLKRYVYEDNYQKSISFGSDACVIFYGTLALGRKIQRELPWIPGVYCNFKNMCCSTYYSYWAKYLLNSDYIMLPILEIERKKEYIYKTFGIDGRIFIRPNSGSKPFTGKILKREEVEKELNFLDNYAGNDLDQIIAVISSPKNIQKEWRCVVVEKQVVAFSQYMHNGKISIKKDIEPEAYSLSEKIAKEEWQPDRVYTIDVCKCNNKYYLLEVNGFSCSGLYKSNVEKVVKEVSEAAQKEYEEYNCT